MQGRDADQLLRETQHLLWLAMANLLTVEVVFEQIPAENLARIRESRFALADLRNRLYTDRTDISHALYAKEA